MKRINEAPKQLEDVLELAKKRFEVLRIILDTNQFKPFISFKPAKLESRVQVETTRDLVELYDMMYLEQKAVSILITVKRQGQEAHNLIPFQLSKQLLT